MPVGRENFVAGEDVEVAIVGLHVDLHVRNGLGAVEQNFGAVTVGEFDDVVNGSNGAERVGNLSEGDEARLGSEQLVIFVEQDLSGVVHGDDSQSRASFGAQHLPGNDVGVMLEPSNDDFIALADILAAPALRDEIDALGCAADEDDFFDCTAR